MNQVLVREYHGFLQWAIVLFATLYVFNSTEVEEPSLKSQTDFGNFQGHQWEFPTSKSELKYDIYRLNNMKIRNYSAQR